MAYINKIQKKKRNENTESRERRRKYYNSKRWQELRESVMFDSGGLCSDCQKLKDPPVLTPAVDIHHIVSPFQYDDEWEVAAWFYSYSNLVCLCKKCHAIRHLNN